MSGPSLLRRLFLCRLDLCNLWRREKGTRGGYECTGCGRLSMLRDRPKPRDGASIFPRFEIDAPMPAPPNPPSGGPSERPAPICTIAPSLDSLHPAFADPVIGFMSEVAFKHLADKEGWYAMVYRDRRELAPRVPSVEVEVRLRRVVET